MARAAAGQGGRGIALQLQVCPRRFISFGPITHSVQRAGDTMTVVIEAVARHGADFLGALATFFEYVRVALTNVVGSAGIVFSGSAGADGYVFHHFVEVL